jgi:hypothetical protein
MSGQRIRLIRKFIFKIVVDECLDFLSEVHCGPSGLRPIHSSIDFTLVLNSLTLVLVDRYLDVLTF